MKKTSLIIGYHLLLYSKLKKVLKDGICWEKTIMHKFFLVMNKNQTFINLKLLSILMLVMKSVKDKIALLIRINTLIITKLNI